LVQFDDLRLARLTFLGELLQEGEARWYAVSGAVAVEGGSADAESLGEGVVTPAGLALQVAQIGG
jgi:hypothetical protein